MILIFYFRFLQVGWFRVQVYFLSDRCFFHKYYINFRIIFAVEAGEKILQQAYNNKVYEYCEKKYYLQVNVILFYCKIDTKEKKAHAHLISSGALLGPGTYYSYYSATSLSVIVTQMYFFCFCFFSCYIGPFHLDSVRTIETTYQKVSCIRDKNVSQSMQVLRFR